MTNLILRGRDYRTLQPIELEIEHGTIIDVRALSELEEEIILAPGLVDLQVNGFQGVDFNHFPFSEEDVLHATRALWQQGVTSFLPTVITAMPEGIAQAMQRLASACQHHPDVARAVPGFHLEGPFLSPEDGPRGAHPREAIRAPDIALFDSWQHAAQQYIRLLTLSPEWPHSDALIKHCVAQQVRVAIGHTSATPEQIHAAVDAGATLSTHLGNGAHLQLPRHPNYIWQQLAEDALTATLIADGDHLPADVLKVFLRAKGEQALLVSDVTSFAGQPPGIYDTAIGGRVQLSASGRLSIADAPQLLAGSARGLLDGVNFLLRQQLATLAQAIDMASIRPARQLNLPQQQGLACGAPADVLLLAAQADGSVALRGCVKQGAAVWSENADYL
ncbi:N-acetylglucosamine-6-phosphate deacetylase [Pantoea trifolii]|uniref:N-acetylglucosamine-6-phosphate deacetylase n=1 Tax=Candidatus Pantoea symbiotica TaxID=1884370 RepID=UPI00077BEE6F|nr:amidohydrolase family protein [Pantoea rodasii]MDY0924818.1 amidohydrolase family protein [Enterobacter sp. CFBP8995]